MASKIEQSEIKMFSRGNFLVWLYNDFRPENVNENSLCIIHHNESEIKITNGEIVNFMFIDNNSIEIEIYIDNHYQYMWIECSSKHPSSWDFFLIKKDESGIIEFYSQILVNKDENFSPPDTPEEYRERFIIFE